MFTIAQVLNDLTKHGYLMLFAWIAAEMLGAPLPAVPILLAAGVLTATGQLSFATALAIGVLACLVGDTAWYCFGRRWGSAVLRILCKISLEPESCVRRGSDFVSRHGNRTLLVAKFVPGISTMAVPMMANSGTAVATFLLYDFLGSALYVGAYLAAGRFIGRGLDTLVAVAHSIGSASVALALLGAIVMIARRYYQRREFQRQVGMSRILAPDLRDLIERGDNPFVVDLRHPLDMLADPRVIPGALRLTPDELASRQNEIPRDREIILYCT